MKKRALISVSDKTGVVAFAEQLHTLGFEIISTGGTRAALVDAGVPTIAIEEVTDFPEMLDGRVKTLHPKIHGGLLGRRDLPTHQAEMAAHHIVPIDVVVVNLYPFKATIMQPDVTLAEAIEQIDIGGPSMLRSAAKNHRDVTVVVDPADYDQVLTHLADHDALAFRQKLAAKVFQHTAAYDAIIAEYLIQQIGETQPATLTKTYTLKQTLRYGENNHQHALFYEDALPEAYSIAQAQQLHGKELSYNNIRDADAALRIAREYSTPTVVALKHMNPCGIGTGKDIFSAYQKAYDADPVSIFGGIIVLNRPVDLATAQAMYDVFLEIVLAPSFTAEALQLLQQKKNLRLLTLDFTAERRIETETVSVLGGLLVQEQDVIVENTADWQVVTKRQPTKEELLALMFAWKAVKHVKSNAIVLANADQTVGIGAGQMNRVGAVKIAVEQARVANKLTDAVMASDAFFPMPDSVEYAAKNGIKAIIQPGGSVKDEASIAMADTHGITMIFTGVRHFRH